MSTPNISLSRDSFGKLNCQNSAGEIFYDLKPVRAFPIQAPDQGISLVQSDGKEVAWIDDINSLPSADKELLQDELNGREFMPEVEHILSISSFATPSTWRVQTNRGVTEFVLKGDEDLRRVGAHALLISDSHGIHFLIRDMSALDKHSRKILDRFL